MRRSLVAMVLLLGIMVSVGGCGDNGPTDDGDVITGTVKGFVASPKGFPLTFETLLDFYAEVAAMQNGAVLWQMPWLDDLEKGTDAGKIPAPAVTLSRNAGIYNFIPVPMFLWRADTVLYLKTSVDETNNWTNTDTRTKFIAMLKAYVTEWEPPYIFLGSENEFYYQQDPQDYANWIDFYNEAYDAVKQIAPDIKIGPGFNFEHIAGISPYREWTEPQWEALTMHDMSKVDVVGITLYPWLVHDAPGDVPTDYLAPLVQKIGGVGGKPIAVTETGWPGEDQAKTNPAWQTSETAQTAYLSRLKEMFSGQNIDMLNWKYLYPRNIPGGIPPSADKSYLFFGSVSLRDYQGNKRPIYDPWVEYLPSAQ